MKKEIVLCGSCEGLGYHEIERLTDYHKGEYDHWDEKCNICDGKGRRMKITMITYEVFPEPELKEQ